MLSDKNDKPVMFSHTTSQDRYWHDIYESLTDEQREAIDDAFDTVVFELRGLDLNCSMVDPAEALISAIARYIVCSNPKQFELPSSP